MTEPHPTIIRDTTTLDAATDEFLDAFQGFMLTQITGIMFQVPEIAASAAYCRLMAAATWLDTEREKHAAAGIFDSANYDDDLMAEILGGVR